MIDTIRQRTRQLDARLTHRIVRNGFRWAKARTANEAFAALDRRGPVQGLVSVWAVTESTTIADDGRFKVPGVFVQPADVTDEPELH